MFQLMKYCRLQRNTCGSQTAPIKEESLNSETYFCSLRPFTFYELQLNTRSPKLVAIMAAN